MRLNFSGIMLHTVRSMAEASAECQRLASPATLEDEGEVIATVTAMGRLYDVEGRLIPVGHLRRVA